MQWDSGDKDSCLCVESYTYQHKAVSPAFEIDDYASTEYSTWAESRSVLIIDFCYNIIVCFVCFDALAVCVC